MNHASETTPESDPQSTGTRGAAGGSVADSSSGAVGDVDERSFVLRAGPFGGDRDVVMDMRHHRQRRRFGQRDLSDVAYRVYATVLLTLFLLSQVGGVVGDDPLSSTTSARLVRLGPAWIGLLAAATVLAGARSGCRGGPVAIEAADAHHLLGAPRHRWVVMHRPAARMLLQAVAGGALAGALSGDIAAERFDGSPIMWAAGGAWVGAVAATASVGIGLVAAGRRWSARRVTPVGVAVIAWSALDIVTERRTSPFTLLGRAAFWGDRFSAWPLVWCVPVAAVATMGLGWLGGVSVEDARRRTALVGQLRFAVAQRDLRTVMLLRRQLASDLPRVRPWFTPPRWLADRAPIVARDLVSTARWPLPRVVRVLALAVAAGLCLRGVWSGTTPLLVPAGGALYIAALDVVEPLAQEVDHPFLLWSLPLPRGDVLLRHIVGPALVMTVLGVVAVATAYLAGFQTAVGVGGLMLIGPAALAAVAGAALSVVSEPVMSAENEGFIPPELAGPRVLIKAVWPVAVATIGVAPVALAARARAGGDEPLAALLTTTGISLAVTALVLGWIWKRDAIIESMAPAGEAR